MSTPVSPADRYAAARRQRAEDSPGLSAFLALYDFEFDDFQLRACRALDGGHGVLLAAPTGSGKTVVGEFAVHLALAEGRKCFYTTPIKALSNQKYADLVRRYSAARVGLLTGDNSINGEAPVVVMTTEVLRNMLYAGSPTLGSLGYVVLDEVHYLADRFRGAVWEEVIIHLPESVRLVALSATVSNAEEFGDWLAQVRGGTTVIVDEHRPVPLWQHMLAGGRLYDLFVTDHDQPAVAAGPPDGRSAPGEGGRTGGRGAPGEGGRTDGRGAPARPARGTSRPRAMVNPELLRIAQREQWAARKAPGRPGRGGRRPPRFRGTSRPDVIGRLDAAGLLPAITFIFSRAGCDAAVQQCLAAGLRLTTPEEAAEITALAERHTADIPREDLPVLGYGEWLLGLQRGIAAHHAGLLPTFKQVVEELFTAGLVRAVFATETLALGINMPARTVVIERLDKWNGETHADLTPGEYTQLTGRAGRRGIDVEGHAVVLWQPGDDPAAVAGLAGTRTYPLSSSFRPSYNMAVNLVGQVGREQASALLESSFAQFQADRAVAGIARQARRSRKSMAEAAVSCHLGDFDEYIAIRRELSQREGDQARRRSADRRAEALRSLQQLRRGDIIRVPSGRRAGIAVVIDPFAGRGDEPLPLVLTANRQVKQLSAADFPVPVAAIERIRIPASFSVRSANHRRDLAATMRNRLVGVDLGRLPRDAAGGASGADGTGRAGGADGTGGAGRAGDDGEIAMLRQRLRQHPCHGCQDRDEHARQAEQYLRIQRQAELLERKVAGRSHVIARTFDQVCGVLTQLGYLDGDQVTAEGTRLASLYTELDLLASECLRRGLWDALTPAELAACVSALTFESRQPEDAAPPRLPGGRVRDMLAAMVRVWSELDGIEREHKLSFLREPDMGFAWNAHAWAQGRRLETVLETGLTPGDFVRAAKQLIDLLDQVALAAGQAPLGAKARAAIDALRRGVVAYSSVG
ncbi:MAG TPA: DEAD/DEAH box helicase [Streptosporangiaceae bacterium]|nr:DEAD/DEAH box helicase [Streptosporangiaceae bacterium]